MSPQILNLFAFVRTFRLDAVSFCKDKGTFQMIFLPDTKDANERFEIGHRVFQDVGRIWYYEQAKKATFKVVGEVFASQVKEGFTLNGRDLNGLVSVELKGDPARFPDWASEQAGQVKLVLKDRKDFVFPFARTG